jgi:hypothetical protein
LILDIPEGRVDPFRVRCVVCDELFVLVSVGAVRLCDSCFSRCCVCRGFARCLECFLTLQVSAFS